MCMYIYIIDKDAPINKNLIIHHFFVTYIDCRSPKKYLSNHLWKSLDPPFFQRCSWFSSIFVYHVSPKFPWFFHHVPISFPTFFTKISNICAFCHGFSYHFPALWECLAIFPSFSVGIWPTSAYPRHLPRGAHLVPVHLVRLGALAHRDAVLRGSGVPWDPPGPPGAPGPPGPPVISILWDLKHFWLGLAETPSIPDLLGLG